MIPVGELDLATVGQLEQELRRLYESGVRNLLLDLSELTFMDSSGVHLVISWDDRARSNGINFGIIQGGPSIGRTFEILGLQGHLPFVSKESGTSQPRDPRRN